jgi:hypothetical protein
MFMKQTHMKKEDIKVLFNLENILISLLSIILEVDEEEEEEYQGGQRV